jgi:peptidoglycan/xylan/chitin deacetylase (PgdA/CDA1 family)
MIGVLADEREHSVIREFFELFKTPWEFYRSNSRYDVLICSNAPFQKNSANLVLIYGVGRTTFEQEFRVKILGQRSNTVLSYKEDPIPIYGDCFTFKGDGPHTLVHEQTGEPAAVEIALPEQTLVRIGFDLFQEIRYLLTRGQPSAQARIPTLEMHIAVIRDLIVSHSLPLVEIPPVPAGYTFIVCLTHDVDHVGIRNHKCDHTMFGFLYRATIGSLINFCVGRRSAGYLIANWMAAFSLPFVHLGLIKDFWNRFDRYIDIETGLNSTFFVIPKKGDPGQNASGPVPVRRAARYDVAEIKDQVQRLISAGREIALHGIDAWHDTAKGRTELETIQRLTGESRIGVRMHWLFFDENSPIKLEEAGFSYDSTVGYNETVGYRAGTAQVFKPLGAARMLELPMHIMDTALFFPAHMNLSPKQAECMISDLIDSANRFGGALTTNWHDRSIAPERLWGDVYQKLLDNLKKKGAWFATAAQTVSWFGRRRSAVIENVAREANRVRVKVSVDQSNDALPGLRIRVNKPSPKQRHLSGQAEPRDQFAEVTLNHSAEVEIAL